jgi:3-hydroxyacyl-CoA dehydrogenase/enoyl-CoA hydratase/3-hydroxybutyryl-CoA epimerase
MSLAGSGSSWRWERGQEGVWTLWFDQAHRSQNVLDRAALDELETGLLEVERQPELKSLVIRSAKAKGFCAGVDLKAILACRTAAEVETYVGRGLAVFDRLSALAVPSVAVIHGACLGGGLELALACRRRVALASAAPLQIGTPDIRLGLIPAWGAIEKLPRLMGPDDGLDLLLSGRVIGYLLARSHGLVDRLAAEPDLEESVISAGSAVVPERTWPSEAWDSAWTRAHAQVDAQPAEHPEAQLKILTIVAIDVAHGHEAAREAATPALAELAMTDVVRASLEAFIRDEQEGSAG